MKNTQLTMIESKKIIVLISLLLSFSSVLLANDVLTFPIKEHFGYGNFTPSGGGIRWEKKSSGKWAKMEKELKGLPTSWSKLTTKQVVFDYHQFVFQNYKQGNITKHEFLGFVNSWDIDTAQNLSSQPIDCFIYMVIGKDENDSLVYILDTDKDYDFSNNAIKFPLVKEKIIDSLIDHTAHFISFEFFNEDFIFR